MTTRDLNRRLARLEAGSRTTAPEEPPAAARPSPEMRAKLKAITGVEPPEVEPEAGGPPEGIGREADGGAAGELRHVIEMPGMRAKLKAITGVEPPAAPRGER